MSDYRLRLPRSITTLVQVTVAGFLIAAEPVQPSQVDTAAVKMLLTRLESDRATERAAAAKALQALGPGVLPHLPPPDRMETASARDVVIQIRNVLERELARESARASMVTLERTATRAELCAEMTSQTGNAIGVTGSRAEQPRKVDWQRRPFWNAMDDLLESTSEQILWQPSSGRYVIEPRSLATKSGVAHVGAFRAEAQVGAIKSVPHPDEKAVLRVVTTWQAEPRLRPLFLRVKASDWHGTIGNTRLPAWNPDAEYELPFADGARQLSWPFDVDWSPPREAKNWSLHGRATVHLAAMTETITFDPVALRPNVQRRRGGVAVRIRAVDFHPDEQGLLSATIRIHVTYDTGGPAFESHRAWVFYQGASLLGAKGERIAFTDYEATQEANGAVGVEYRFHKLPGRSSDYRLAYDAPTLFLDVPLEITFRDLPLPE